MYFRSLIVALAACFSAAQAQVPPGESITSESTVLQHEPDGLELPVTAVKAISGDVILLDSGTECRLIGVKSPAVGGGNTQSEFMGEEARAFTDGLVRNRELQLTFDRRKSEAGGRWLAYAWFEDGSSLNERIISEGFGILNRKDKVRPEYREALEGAEAVSHDRKKGIWSDGIKARSFLENSLVGPSVRPVEDYRSTGSPTTSQQPFRPREDSGTRPGATGTGLNRGPAFYGVPYRSTPGLPYRPSGIGSNNFSGIGQNPGEGEKREAPRSFRAKEVQGGAWNGYRTYYKDQPFFAPGILKPRTQSGTTGQAPPPPAEGGN